MRGLILVALLIVCSLTGAQEVLNREVTVSFEHYSVEKCLLKIEQKSGVSFSYNSRQISEIHKNVTVDFSSEPLSEILKYIFSDTDFRFKEIGGQVTIYLVENTASALTLSGFVRIKDSREELIGARVYFPNLETGCYTNSYGYYSLEIPEGKHHYMVTSMGMKPLSGEVEVNESMVLNLSLEISSIELDAVPVLAKDSSLTGNIPVNLSNPEKTVLTQQAVLRLPAAGGEPDVLKGLQQFPGVQAALDGTANYQVRGSVTGNNLILLDEIPIYHPTHLLGIYSIINVDAVKSADLYKDYIPAKFGTRNASILQIHTKEGDMQKHHVSGSMSFISMRMNVEGPLVRNKSSFYISGRKSLFPGAASNILNQSAFSYPSYFDLNGKANFQLNSNNRIYLTGYLGKDHLNDTNTLYTWGNLAGGLRWSHIFHSKLFSQLNLAHSEFRYQYLALKLDEVFFGQKVVTDRAMYSITNFYSNKIRFEYGLDINWVQTGKVKRSGEETDLFLERSAFENSVFGSVDIKFSPRLNLKAGLRVPVSFHLGTQDTTTFLNPDLSQVQVIYEKNKLYDLNFFVDPRVMLSYAITENQELLITANVVSQNTHSISYVNYFLPLEIWTTSNKYLKPQRSVSQSVGWLIHHKSFESSVTIFNRHVFHVVDYAAPVFTASQDIESNILSGRLHAYGAEFQFNFHKTDRYTASIAYTYMKATQIIEGINGSNPYPALNDKPHYFTFSQYIKASKKWQIATNLILHSGSAVTLPNGQFTINGVVFPLFPMARNAEKLPYYCRLDVSFTRKLGIKRDRDFFYLALHFTNFLGRSNTSVAYVDTSDLTGGSFALNSIDYAPSTISINLTYKF